MHPGRQVKTPFRVRIVTAGSRRPDGPHPGEAHVWLFRLTGGVADSWDCLCDAERRRAARLNKRERREQFVRGRGRLRRVLADYLAIDPSEVPLTCEAGGKPIICPHSRWADWHFNLTHSRDLAALAVTRSVRVGVDLEALRPVERLREFVGRFFSPGERDQFAALPDTIRLSSFFHGWTRKEAVIKAMGLSVQRLDEFDVTLAPEGPARVLSWQGESAAGGRWSLGSWEATPGFVLGLAAETDGAAGPAELVH